MKNKPPKRFEKQQVRFMDHAHGFTRLGTCYKEKEKECWIRTNLGKRYKVNINDVTLYVATQHDSTS